MSFREITLKEIGKITSFSRPTIYNYFETKEEIFLALFKREYDLWNEQFKDSLVMPDSVRDAFMIALKKLGYSENSTSEEEIKAANNFDMEANSRQEILTSFKQSYGRSLHLMSMLLTKFCPDMSVEDIQNFIYIFFPFMFGIYPYTEVTENQKNAMKDAGINYVYQTVYELTCSCLIRLLGE